MTLAVGCASESVAGKARRPGSSFLRGDVGGFGVGRISRGRLLPVTASTSASATASLSRPFSATAHFPLITFRAKAAAGGPRVGIDVQTTSNSLGLAHSSRCAGASKSSARPQAPSSMRSARSDKPRRGLSGAPRDRSGRCDEVANRPQRGRVAARSEAGDHGGRDRRHERAVVDRLAAVDVGDMQLDDRAPETSSSASMIASDVKVNAAGIDDDAAGLVDRLVDPVDELVFPVRLPEHDRPDPAPPRGTGPRPRRGSCARRSRARACRGGSGSVR